jgi:hypothetical protein
MRSLFAHGVAPPAALFCGFDFAWQKSCRHIFLHDVHVRVTFRSQ